MHAERVSVVVDSTLSKRAQEPKQLVIGLKAFCFLTCGRHFFEGLLFESQIRFDIAVRGLSALVTKPQGDDGDIDSRLQKVHSACVAIMS